MNLIKKLLSERRKRKYNPSRIMTTKEASFSFEIKKLDNGSHILEGHGWCWFNDRPHENDGLICKMESGKQVLYRFFDVDRCANPNDMYFAKGEPIKYYE